jgi:hypothetical protein
MLDICRNLTSIETEITMIAVPDNRTAAQQVASFRRSVAEVLAPLDALAAASTNLLVQHGASFEVGGELYDLPRYIFLGPKGGDEPIRVGLFAGIHGDEPEGTHALVKLLRLLDARLESAAGYCLFVYPVCNPSGFEDATRHSRAGKDLNREFWTGSRQPEVRLLETELTTHTFHGIVSLHTDDTSDGFYGYARGATLTEHLIEPALSAAERFLPRNRAARIDGFGASNGIIRESFGGVLSAPPDVQPRPFEVILETPKAPPQALKEAAFLAALQSVLANYRELIAYAPNL